MTIESKHGVRGMSKIVKNYVTTQKSTLGTAVTNKGRKKVKDIKIV